MKIITLLTSALLITTFSVVNLYATPKKPFLIQDELPHLSGMVHILWDDEDVALTNEQKKQLLSIKQNTMSKAKALGEVINTLEAEIVKASADDVIPNSLKESVEKLALLRAKATMIHLNCIYNTRAVLTQEQLEIIE